MLAGVQEMLNWKIKLNAQFGSLPLQLETIENGGKLQGRRINFKRYYLLSIELLIKVTPITKKTRQNFACCAFFVKWKCPV